MDGLYELIRQDVERVNSALPLPARVRSFVLLHKEFDADEGELTRTRKLRRGLLGERYGDMIEAMYGGLDSVQVRAAVKYRDGREGVIKTTVRIATLDEGSDTPGGEWLGPAMSHVPSEARGTASEPAGESAASEEERAA